MISKGKDEIQSQNFLRSESQIFSDFPKTRGVFFVKGGGGVLWQLPLIASEDTECLLMYSSELHRHNFDKVLKHYRLVSGH